MELGRPPYTHDRRLGSPINADTEGHTDSIMAKHRKDRDSWGECTYNIPCFHCRTDLFSSIAPSRRGHCPKSCLFQAPSPIARLHFGTFEANVHLSWLRCGKLRDSLLYFVCYCRPVMQKRADIKKKKKVLRDVFNKHTVWAVLGPPKGLKHPSWFYFDLWASQGFWLHLRSNYVILHQ